MPFDGLYHAEPIDHGGWTGFRFLSHEDEVYEALTDGEAEARLYGDGTGWNVAVRFPTETDEDAYGAWEDVAARLVSPDRADLTVDGLTFHDEKDDGMERSAKGVTLRYNPEGEPLVPTHSYSGVPGELAVVGGAGGGWAATTGGIFAGAVPDLGAAMGLWAGITAAAVGGNYVLPRAAARINNWRSHRRYGSEDRIADTSLVDRLNERNSLEQYLEEVGYEEAKSARYDELDGEDLDATLRQLLNTHFDRFDTQQGVLAATESETYSEAAAFLSTVADRPYSGERPRITGDRDRFEAVFEHCTFRDDVLDQGRDLIRRVVEEDADEDVETFLEETRPDVTREVAATVSLEHTLEPGHG